MQIDLSLFEIEPILHWYTITCNEGQENDSDEYIAEKLRGIIDTMNERTAYNDQD